MSESAPILPPQPWPSAQDLAEEITTYVLHAKSDCGCDSIAACLKAREQIEQLWSGRILRKHFDA